MSFSSRYVCVCVCCTYVDLCVRSISWPFVVPSHFPNQCANCQASAGQGQIKGKSRALYRSIVSTKIGSTNCCCCCCCCKLQTCGMSAHLSSGRKISRGKVKQFAIKSTLNLHSSKWGLYLGYLVSSLSKIYDLASLLFLSSPSSPSTLQ